jgi:hypothetical protein
MTRSDVHLNILGSVSCEDLIRLGIVKPVDQELLSRTLNLVTNVEYDIDVPLLPEDE